MNLNDSLQNVHSADGFLKLIGDPGSKKGLHAEVKGLGGRRFSKQGYEGTVSISQVISAAAHVINKYGASSDEKAKIALQIKFLDEEGNQALAKQTGSSKFAHFFHKLFGEGSDPAARKAALDQATKPKKSTQGSFAQLGPTIVAKFTLPDNFMNSSFREQIKILLRDAVREVQKEIASTATNSDFIQKVKDKFNEKIKDKFSEAELTKINQTVSRAVNQTMKMRADRDKDQIEEKQKKDDVPITPRSRGSRPKPTPPVTRQQSKKDKAA